MAGRDDRIGRRPAGSSPSELFPDRVSLRRDESSHSKDVGHDRGRGGGKGGGLPCGKHSKPPLERSSSRRSTNASDRGSISTATAGQRATKVEGLPLVVDLLGDAACLRMQHNQADNKLKRTLADWKRSAAKTPEYSSVDEMQRQAVQKCENEKNNLKQKLRELHPTLCDTFDSLFKQYVQDQASIGPNTQQGADPSPTKVQGSPAELQPQSLEPHQSTKAWMENCLQTELNKFKNSLPSAQGPDNSEIQKLVDSLENEKKKTQLLENKVEEGRQQHRLLEEKLSRLEQKLDGASTTMEERIAAKKSQPATSTTSAEHNQLKLTVEMQGRTIDLIKTEDIASLRSSVEQIQESQGSQEARLSTPTSLKPLVKEVKEQQKKANVLQQRVDALQASAADWSLQDFQNLKARVQGYPPAGEIQQLLVEFPSLVDTKRLLAKYPPSGDLKRLLEEMPPPGDIRRLLGECPSPADIKRRLEELPPSDELNQLVRDVPKLRESMSEVNARSSKLPTPTPAPAFMTKEMTLQLITPKMDRLEDALKSRCADMIQISSVLVAETVDQANARTLKSEEAVQALDARVTGLKRSVDENKKEFDAHVTTLKRNADENKKKLDQQITVLGHDISDTKKDTYDLNYDMEKHLEEQATELKSVKGMVAVMIQDVEKVRKDSRTGIDDVQFQLVQMTDWAKNFSSKQWHDSVAQQIAAYVPAQFAGQLDSLATRVSHLETRSHDSPEVSSKRRKGANGSPLVVNGIH
ncbi:hypothetical protein Forpe1208_v004784 [Fusarium oxysporum f. sp. rapae]|uniref:Uncharacterized protein n=1 Tax=Fusarium oxysporum f. sp. rapae TaxID=485398 RepID=A0A8J5U1D6_FUSOX|nr:hypothetical protein Forpe1208_v004784 [Fusarium oxysporum f. sp. rapae]